MSSVAADQRTAGPARTTGSRGLIVLIGLLSGLGPFALDVYLPGLPALSRGLHASAAAGGLTITACMIGIAAGQLVGGPVSDAVGRRVPLLVAMVVFTLTSLGCAVVASMPLLIGLRLVQGVGGGFAAVIARTIIRDHYEGREAARKYSVMMGINGLAPVIAPTFGGLLLKVTSWRGEFVALAVLGAVLTVACLVLARESLPVSERHRGGLASTLRAFSRLLGDRTFIPYVLAFSVAFGSMFAYISASAFVLENIFHVSPQLYGVIFAANEAGWALAALASGWLLRYFTAVQLLCVGLIGVAVSSVVVLIVAISHLGLWLLLPMLFVQLSCQGLTLANGVSLAMAGQERNLGSASALLGFSQYAVGALVAPLVGLAGAHDALPMGIVMCVCGVAALGIGLVPVALGARSRS
jgi:MFS transporter, DHA1 family, multidrug resistance protein